MIAEIQNKKGGSRKKICTTCGDEKGPKSFNAGQETCRQCQGVGQYKSGCIRPPKQVEHVFIGDELEKYMVA